MRLYLSSFRMGDEFDRLIEALPPGGSVAIVSNAVDFIPMEERLAYAQRVYDPVDIFKQRGLAAFDLDLRPYFGRQEALRTKLADVPLVWAVGGNAFLLRRALRQSGLDKLLQERVADGTIIYGGWSAGAVVAGSTLRGIHLMDDPELVVEGYDAAPVWDGLGLVDVVLVPHFQSAHQEAGAADAAVAWLTDAALPFRTLRDGEVVTF